MMETVWEEIICSIIFNAGCILLAKCFFEKSVLVDRKNSIFLVLASVLDGAGGAWNSIWSKPFSLAAGVLFAYCFLRGGAGKVRRLLSVVEVVVFFYVNLMFYIVTMEVIYNPYDREMTFLDTTNHWFYLFVFLIFLLICYTYVKLYRKKITLELQIRDKLMLGWYSLFLIVFFSIWLVLTEESGVKMPTSFSVLCMLLLTTLALLAFLGMVKKKLSDYYKKGMEYQQEYMEVELAHFREYKQAQDEIRRVRHDMRNNLVCISMLLEEGKNQEAKTYVTQLLGEVKAFSPKVVTGDEMLDAIVASKWSKMEERQISFVLDGVLAQGLKWKPIDICTVFSNGLDNAIEACEKVEGERNISLSLRYSKNFYYIILSNSMEGSVPILEKEKVSHKFGKKSPSEQKEENQKSIGEKLVIGSRYTTKKNKELHGYGLENMDRTIKKYDGTMSIWQGDNQFVLNIMVPLQSVL